MTPAEAVERKPTITIIRDAYTDRGGMIPAGSVVPYLGHIVGGMVSVLHNGDCAVIDPRCAKELA